MRTRLEARLAELRAEFESGQTRLGELEAQARSLRETLLRISGAIQVLEEELDPSGESNASPSGDGGEDGAEIALVE